MNDNTPVSYDPTTKTTYTVNDLMLRWDCRRKSILEAIREKRLRAFKVGKRIYRVTAEEVARFEQANAKAEAA